LSLKSSIEILIGLASSFLSARKEFNSLVVFGGSLQGIFFYFFTIYIYSMPPGRQGDTVSQPVVNKNFIFFLAKHSLSILRRSCD